MSTKDGPQNSWAQRDYENGIRAKDGQGIVDEDGNVVLPAAPIPIPAGYSDLKAPSSIEELMGLEGTMKQKRYANIPYKDVALFYPKASNSKEDFWYVIVAVALMAMGRQHLIATLWRHLSDAFIKQMETEEAVPLSGEKVRAGAAGKAQDEGKGGSQESIEDLVWKSKRLREGILKASVLVGFPRVRCTLHD